MSVFDAVRKAIRLSRSADKPMVRFALGRWPGEAMERYRQRIHGGLLHELVTGWSAMQQIRLFAVDGVLVGESVPG